MKAAKPTLMFLLGATACLTMCAAAQGAYYDLVVNDPGLLAYYRLGETPGTNIIVDQKGTQNGWNGNNVGLGVPGSLLCDPDTAADFPGSTPGAVMVAADGQYTLPSGHPLRSLSSGDFTVEAWVQPDALHNGWLVAHDGGNSNLDFALGLKPNGAFWFLTRDLANLFDTASSGIFVTQDDIDNNRWFHVVGVQDVTNGRCSIYVDGLEAGFKTSVAGSGEDSSNAVRIGSRSSYGAPNYGAEFFNGAIDEVAVYSRALSADEVLLHYQAAVPEPSTLVLLAGAGLALIPLLRRRRK